MNFSWFRGISKKEDLTADKYNKTWYQFEKFWNDHDSGNIAFTSISYGTATLEKATNYTIGISDQTILVDATSAIRTITLPNSNGLMGRRFTIKDWQGQSATHNITIATVSSQTIDGSTTKVMGTNYQVVNLISDGTNWAIV